MSMKKEYLKPTVDTVECECVSMIAASSEQLKNGGDIPTSKSSSSSSWGNIWNN